MDVVAENKLVLPRPKGFPKNQYNHCNVENNWENKLFHDYFLLAITTILSRIER